MMLLPLADCCHRLAVDPKTLRSWARKANMELAAHPADARIKCLTQEQVQQLAVLHARPITLSEALASTPMMEALQMPPHPPEADLQGKLSHLEIQVAALQQQLAQLALELLHERTQRYEQRLQTLEAFIHPPQQSHVQLQALLMRGEENQQAGEKHKKRDVHPAELCPRARVSPLVEYGAYGTYVIICPQDGELRFPPDSPAWFDWLATLSSFRFVGQHGRFSAYRKGTKSRGWSASRTVHQHEYRHYLGTTDHLTLSCLEQMAAKLQSYVDAF